MDGARELIKMRSRRYTKRQLSWFKRDDRIVWYDMDECTIDEVVEGYHSIELRLPMSRFPLFPSPSPRRAILVGGVSGATMHGHSVDVGSMNWSALPLRLVPSACLIVSAFG